jgi:hypothetical protein
MEFNTTTPANDEVAGRGAERIRDLKVALLERINKNHVFEEGLMADIQGCHRAVELYNPDAETTIDITPILVEESGLVELFWTLHTDAGDVTTQLTENGKILSDNVDLLVQLNGLTSTAALIDAVAATATARNEHTHSNIAIETYDPLLTLYADTTKVTQTSGALVVGREYHVQTFVTGDDFTNVGGLNVSGTSFKASGTTPTIWTNLSELTYLSAKTNKAEGTLGNSIILGTKNTLQAGGNILYVQYPDDGYVITNLSTSVPSVWCRATGAANLCTNIIFRQDSGIILIPSDVDLVVSLWLNGVEVASQSGTLSYAGCTLVHGFDFGSFNLTPGDVLGIAIYIDDLPYYTTTQTCGLIVKAYHDYDVFRMA